MKEIDLPIVKISTDLDAAIVGLENSKRGALLVKQNEEYHLFSAGNIVVGRKKGGVNLSELKPDAIIRSKALHQQLRRLDVEVTLPDMGGGGGEVVSDYILSKVTGAKGYLKIRSLALASKYVSSPKLFYCDGPRHHDDFFPPNVQEGDLCPHEDGYHIVSSR